MDASADSQITHVRIYRTTAGGSAYYHDQDVAIGSTNVDTNTADTALGDEVETDHNRPPAGGFVIGPNFNGVCFILLDNKLYFCKAKQPEYWPTTYYVEVGTLQNPCISAAFYGGQPYVLTKYRIYHIQGTGANTFFPIQLDALTGTQAKKCALSVHGEGLFHLGNDGVYVFAGNDINFTETAFLPIFRGLTVNGIPGIDLNKLDRCWLIQFRGYVYFGYCDTSDNYPSNCLVFHIRSKRAAYYEWGREIRAVAIDETNNRLLAADVNGYVWHLENRVETQDNSVDIDYEAESKAFVLQTRRNFPRWSKYDVDASSSTSCTGEIIIDGSTLQSHTISGDRNTKRRLIITGNGKRASVRISGSGPVEIYAAEFE